MDLVTLNSTLRTKVGSPSTAEVDNTVLTRLNNEAYEEIFEKYIFHKGRKIVTFPTVADSALYDVPADCMAVFSLWNTTENYQRKILKKDENWLANQQTNTAGPPIGYVRQRGWIQLSPTPDQVYTIRLFYKASYTALSADADVPVIPASWHPGIWRLARYNYWDEKGDLAKAQWAQAAWVQWVSDKPDELQEEYQMDDTEGVVMPGLVRSAYPPNTFNSQQSWDKD